MKRFFHPGLADAAPGERLSLDDGEAHHLRDVLRVAEGETVELFDGAGRAAPGLVSSVTRRAVIVQCLVAPICDPPNVPQLWLAVAPPKADRLRWLVEKCVELDVDRLLLIRTARTVVQPGEGKLHKLTDTALQACKQCRRNRLLDLAPLIPWEQVCRELFPADQTAASATRLLLADREGAAVSDALAPANAEPVQRVIALIGPEGGFDPEELRQAIAGGADRKSVV